jgi:hypothetical protein
MVTSLGRIRQEEEAGEDAFDLTLRSALDSAKDRWRDCHNQSPARSSVDPGSHGVWLGHDLAPQRQASPPELCNDRTPEVLRSRSPIRRRVIERRRLSAGIDSVQIEYGSFEAERVETTRAHVFRRRAQRGSHRAVESDRRFAGVSGCAAPYSPEAW